MIEEATNIDRMRETALDQHGYITAAQAAGLGVGKSALSMLCKRDRVERISYGVYRIPQVPAGANDGFMLAVLWTGAPEAVISHESALGLYGVCDVNPRAIDVTVGKNRRIRRSGGRDYRIHHEDLRRNDMTWRDGVPCVTLAKAIRQCIELGTPSYLLGQAIENGRKQGFIGGSLCAELREELEKRDEV